MKLITALIAIVIATSTGLPTVLAQTVNGVKTIPPWGKATPEIDYGFVQIDILLNGQPHAASGGVKLIGSDLYCNYWTDGVGDFSLGLFVSTLPRASRNECRLLPPGSYTLRIADMQDQPITIGPISPGQSNTISVNFTPAIPEPPVVPIPQFTITGQVQHELFSAGQECYASYYDGNRRFAGRIASDGTFEIKGRSSSTQPGDLLAGCIGIDYPLAYKAGIALDASGLTNVVFTANTPVTHPSQAFTIKVPASFVGGMVGFMPAGSGFPVAWKTMATQAELCQAAPGTYDVILVQKNIGITPITQVTVNSRTTEIQLQAP